jgi:hypothetical protein
VGEKLSGKFSLKMPDFHVAFKDLLHAVNLRYGDPQRYFPSEGRRAEDFLFCPEKNPTVSAGFEPAKLGSKSQHTTSRPPKPLLLEFL